MTRTLERQFHGWQIEHQALARVFLAGELWPLGGDGNLMPTLVQIAHANELRNSVLAQAVFEA